MKITILGTEYDFNVVAKTKDPQLYDCMGYCDPTVRKIGIEDSFVVTYNTVQNGEYLIKKNKRHEIIHAYLF
jgi:hypothetical protein